MGDMEQEELYDFYGGNLGKVGLSASKTLESSYGLFGWLADQSTPALYLCC